MNIATWNVNSLRLRLPQIINWLLINNIDILCLQETKTPDDKFPYDAFEEVGYKSYFYGQKSYNGVAIISKYEALEVSYGLKDYDNEQKRVISITIKNNISIRIICIYCPNGQSLESNKFIYKRQWFNKLNEFLVEELLKYPNLILLGDYNIAPTDADVHDPNIWKNTILVSDEERSFFKELINIGLYDLFREFKQPSSLFSWWDYRNLSFIKNKGLRIDHILASKSIVNLCKSCFIDKTPRKNKQPSDHTPVLINLEIN
ncbi:exodeoxyribonuclease III [Candidatus Kinetoplastibacterium desouzaii TCC079E]|uniref:Exodeoxyribonuclease III n=1 Tax=Candidatus Kinetoplastidibacterium desouzai TCC079E TaxID=1208919 RepID=M1L261_9PROT|nr:exodeoxyribonuclease III [Candidatus Kinetoplastibacterium desouzaii]AGF46838.1 exodeoxyribonuclease III [Candidatus Kinetoplastibacterium desouzaii TCC079E]